MYTCIMMAIAKVRFHPVSQTYPPYLEKEFIMGNALLKSRCTISEGFFFSMFLNMLEKNASICDRQDLFLRKPNWCYLAVDR